MKLLNIPVVLLAQALLANVSLGLAIPRTSIETGQPHIHGAGEGFIADISTTEKARDNEEANAGILGELHTREHNVELEGVLVARAPGGGRRPPSLQLKSAFDPYDTEEKALLTGKRLGSAVGTTAANAQVKTQQAISAGRDAAVGLARTTSQRVQQGGAAAMKGVQQGGAAAMHGVQQVTTPIVESAMGAGRAVGHGAKVGVNSAGAFAQGATKSATSSYKDTKKAAMAKNNNPYPASNGGHGSLNPDSPALNPMSKSGNPLSPPLPLSQRPIHPNAGVETGNIPMVYRPN